MTWLLVAAAGAAGATIRYSIGLAVGPRMFPWATLGINVSGSFALAVVVTLGTARLSQQTATALAVGLIGAYTTFSTFAWETTVLADTGRRADALVYVVASVLLSLLAAVAGRELGESLAG